MVMYIKNTSPLHKKANKHSHNWCTGIHFEERSMMALHPTEYVQSNKYPY